jgi:hypothetical protein
LVLLLLAAIMTAMVPVLGHVWYEYNLTNADK